MTNTLRVQLKSVDGIAVLEGADENATVKTDENGGWLSGDFRIVLDTLGKRFASKEVKFGNGQEAGRVSLKNGEWWLEETAGVPFDFDGGVVWQGSEHCAKVSFSRIDLTQRLGEEFPALLDFVDVGITMRAADVAPFLKGKIKYPEKGNWNSEKSLSGEKHPGDARAPHGYYLRNIGGKSFAVLVGGVDRGIAFDFAEDVVPTVRSTCSIRYRLTDSAGEIDPCLVFAETSRSEPRVSVRKEAGVQIGKLGLGSSVRKVRDIEFRQGRLATRSFKDAQMEIRTIATGKGGVTSLFNKGSAFEFTLEVPEDTIFDPTMHRAEFIYRDPDALAAGPERTADPWKRFYGLKIAGLWSDKQRQEIMDLNLGTVRLFGAGGTLEADGATPSSANRFAFSAGGELDLGGAALEQSTVVPKPDPRRGNERSIGVTTRGMSLTLSGAAIGTNGVARSGLDNTIELRGADGVLSFVKPALSGPPAGHTATAANDRNSAIPATHASETTEFDQWIMGLAEDAAGKTSMAVKPANDALEPAANWLSFFRTDAKWQKTLDHPDLKLKLLGAKGKDLDNPPRPGSIVPKNGSTLDFDDEGAGGNTKKTLVFITAGFVLSLFPWRKELQELADQFKEKAIAFLESERILLGFDFAELKAKDLLKEFVAGRKVDNLQVGYASKTADDAGSMAFRAFIDEQVAEAQKDPKFTQPIGKLYMPLDLGMSVVLMDKQADKNAPYADQIIRKRYEGAKDAPVPAILFNLGPKIATSPALLGYDQTGWKELARKNPVLWPHANDKERGKPDPTDPSWVGVVMRDLPVQFVLPPAFENTKGFLKKVYDTLNRNLILKYGWYGPGKPTWYVTLGSPAGVDVTPSILEDFIALQLNTVDVLGANGDVQGASGELTLELKKFSGTRVDKKNQPIAGEENGNLRIKGRFGFDMSQGTQLSFIELAADDDYEFATNSIPGFEKVALTGIYSDFKTMRVSLELTPSKELASILPIFEGGKPVEAAIVIDLEGKAQSDLQISIATDKDTNFAGKLPFTIQGVHIQIGTREVEENGKKTEVVQNRVIIRGRLGIGLVGLESVGGDIVLDQVGDDDWNFRFLINEIGVDLSLGDNFRMSGALSWAPDDLKLDEIGENAKNTPVEKANLPSEGDKRNFWGLLTIETDGLMGDLELYVKIGSEGEKSFWVGAVKSDASIPLGTAELREPALVLSHNADTTQGGGLRKFITDPNTNQISAIRPTGTTFEERRDWLTQWNASSDIGTVVAGTGYLQLQDLVAEAPAGDTNLMTALVLSDSGFVRIDAQVVFMKSMTIGVGIAIDTRAKRLLGAIRLPEVGIPPKQEPPRILVRPGTLSVLIGYGREDKRLRLGIGWPPLIEGSDIERDWSQATKIYIAELWPINTFWGGFMSEVYDTNTGAGVRMGFAIRAGWTWSAEMNGANIAKASAEIGITLGGVLEFELTFSKSREADVPQALFEDWSSLVEGNITEADEAKAPNVVDDPVSGPVFSNKELAEIDALFGFDMTNALRTLEPFDDYQYDNFAVSANVFGDIWGKGSVEFLGVTLASVAIALRLRIQICGSLGSGITRAYGRGEVEVAVTILCVTYKGRAGFDLWLKRGACELTSRSLADQNDGLQSEKPDVQIAAE